MTDLIVQGVGIAVLSLTAGYVVATIIVELADRLGLCYSQSAEERRHRNDPVPRFGRLTS